MARRNIYILIQNKNKNTSMAVQNETVMNEYLQIKTQIYPTSELHGSIIHLGFFSGFC